MKRQTRQGEELQDHDSFLDIVANMVGILIILVMVVGVKAKDAVSQQAAEPPPAAPIAASEDPEVKLLALRDEALSLQREVLDVNGETKQIFATIHQRQQERSYLTNRVATLEAELKDRSAAMDAEAKEVYEAQLALQQSQAELEDVSKELASVEMLPNHVTKVESLPTPLSRTVHGREVHFQLQGGKLAYVPVDELFEEAKREAREKVWKLDNQLEATELIGPRNGFRMRYTLEKAEIPLEVRKETGRTGYVIRSKSWELIPTASGLGQPFEQAMQPGSQFDALIKSLDPRRVTITVWTYPDSFAEFRQLKKELFGRGFATAGRPLPFGVAIGGSPNGTRSNAQ